ncbi:MAG: hypothetical protein SGI99_16245 [Pseudomonadota bacterium]|nr:hypothetical protein [Pseudomonadota bacterium]
MKQLKVLRVALLLSLCTLAGCGLFSRERKEAYLVAEQGKPLEIPPDLHSPARRDVMLVSSGATSQAGMSEKPVSDIRATSSEVAEKLFIDTDPAQAFERVRDALEQAQIGTLGAVDASSRTIAVRVEVETVNTRWLRKDKVSREEFDRVAQVVADGAKSRVLVLGVTGEEVDDEASKKILSALRERLTD